MYFYLLICLIVIVVINYLNICNNTNNNNIKQKIYKQELILLELKNKINNKSRSITNIENTNIENTNKQPHIDPVHIRDQMVLNDRLYPPLGRTERPQFDLLMNYINSNSGIFNNYTRGRPDTFRSLGYLTPVDKIQTIDSTLILYGRSKYPNSDMGDFYISSSNKMSDIKVPLTEYNSNIRKITDIPLKIIITGNMLNGNYDFTELPKANLDYPYI